MADEPEKTPPERDKKKKEEPSAEATLAVKGKRFAWTKVMSKRWLLVLVAVSLLLQSAGVVYLCLVLPAEKPFGPEVSLGVFRFEADEASHSGISGAQFNLHVSLLDAQDQVARARLTANRFRIQQDIEELLRQAHGQDFVDPALTELKRQLQERVNATIGLRAIALVLITDLEIERTSRPPGETAVKAVEAPADGLLPTTEKLGAN